MRKLSTTILIGIIACSLFKFESVEPIPEPLPEPLEVMPVLVKEAEAWIIGKKTVAWYQDVVLPDGSKEELKSRTQLTVKQWQDKADEIWVARQQEQQNRIENCFDCHSKCGRKI